MWKYWVGVGLVIAVVPVMTLGCSQQPSAPASLIEDKAYPVTPPSVTVRVGIMTGEITDLKVTERVEQGSGRVVSTAKLTGTLKLKNTSVDQSISASSRTAPSHRTDGSRSGTACRPDHGKASVASAASGKSHRGLSPRRCSRPGPSGTVPSSWGGFPLCSA